MGTRLCLVEGLGCVNAHRAEVSFVALTSRYRLGQENSYVGTRVPQALEVLWGEMCLHSWLGDKIGNG